jgi:hypothetical protein
MALDDDIIVTPVRSAFDHCSHCVHLVPGPLVARLALTLDNETDLNGACEQSSAPAMGRMTAAISPRASGQAGGVSPAQHPTGPSSPRSNANARLRPIADMCAIHS